MASSSVVNIDEKSTLRSNAGRFAAPDWLPPLSRSLTEAEHKAVLQAIGQFSGSATQRKAAQAAEGSWARRKALSTARKWPSS